MTSEAPVETGRGEPPRELRNHGTSTLNMGAPPVIDQPDLHACRANPIKLAGQTTDEGPTSLTQNVYADEAVQDSGCGAPPQRRRCVLWGGPCDQALWRR